MKIVDSIKARLLEPSTWAGLAAVLEAAKLLFPHVAGLLVGVQAIVGGVAMLMREAGS